MPCSHATFLLTGHCSHHTRGYVFLLTLVPSADIVFFLVSAVVVVADESDVSDEAPPVMLDRGED